MLISVTFRYVNIDQDDYEHTLESDFDTDLVFTHIRPMLGEGDMNRLETVTYNGDTVHPETTFADLGMVDGGSYHLDVYFPRADEDSDDYSDRVLLSPDTDASVSDWEGWDTPPTTQVEDQAHHTAEEHPVEDQHLGLDPAEVY